MNIPKQKLYRYFWIVILCLNFVIIVVSVVNRDWLKAALFTAFAALSSAEVFSRKQN
jgi:uncharacterized MnhB-related membrane protein